MPPTRWMGSARELGLPRYFCDLPAGRRMTAEAAVAGGLRWSDAVALAIWERRWRHADRPLGYLRGAARRIILNRVRLDERDRLAADRRGLQLVGLPEAQNEPLTAPAQGGLGLHFDVTRAAELAGLDRDAVAVLGVMLGGKLTRRELAEELARRTGGRWNDRRVDAALHRIRRRREVFLAAASELADWLPGLTLAGDAVAIGETTVNQRAETGRQYVEKTIRNEIAARAAAVRKPARVPILTTAHSAVYRQRFYPSPYWVFSFIWDSGDGTMNSTLDELAAVLAQERAELVARARGSRKRKKIQKIFA